MKTTEQTTEEKATRQCWECLKRRLVCDLTRPGCRKCQKVGKECPGYDQQKPLQWIAPGKVSSRRRNKQSQPKQLSPAVQAASRPSKGAEGCEKKKTTCAGVCSHEERALEVGSRFAALVIRDIQKLEGALHGGDPAKVIPYKEENGIPHYGGMLSETSDIVQAVYYFNTQIYPTMVCVTEMAPNPYIMYFPLAALHVLPPSVHHILVCFAMNHRINSVPNGSDRQVVSENWSKVYHHRGEAIRQMSNAIALDKTRCCDATITSVLMFLCVELQQSSSINWRTHSDGLLKLLNMRGGLMPVFRTKAQLAPCIMLFVLIVIMSNTTSPAMNQFVLAGTVDELIQNVTEMYSIIFPNVLCPPELFVVLLRICELRSRASTILFDVDDDTCFIEANDILERIEAFEPKDWAQPNAFYDEWLLIGTMWKASLGIYAICSFQSIYILPSSPSLSATRALYSDSLFLAVKSAMLSSRINKFVLWPLVVLGFSAGYQGDGLKNWVEQQLSDVSRLQGSTSPLKARAVLKRYWAREERSWEECFDRPYAFVV
ncbi:C6 zinc finger domain-containing protein [Massariosphaeria phaeospora]|uniref:C6 zinc finger domain-containing protein n=1 Tax=Massariosphaeria phaeospora TaxID=100035 RepID=A0A7C8I573_9PLEO|nr:C6 zinc finger domain-containing protein [Massariosphaeria phaeospora]